MYDSGITAASLLGEIKNALEIYPPPPESSLIRSYNGAEQLLYSEIIREKRLISITPVNQAVTLSEITVPAGEADISASDIAAVYADGREIERASAEYPYLFGENCYTVLNNTVTFNLTLSPLEYKLLYYARPVRKEGASVALIAGNVMLPAEFTELIAGKIKGEAYLGANEDALASKWLSVYNALLSDFMKWHSQRKAASAGAV